MRANRNYEIAVARRSGEPLAEIAVKHGITVSHVALLAKKNAWMIERCQGRPIADGLTARAAIAIEEAIGLWPTDADKDQVEQRAMEILRSPRGSRVIMVEIGAWLGLAKPEQ